MATPEKPDHYFVVVAVWDEMNRKYKFVLDDDTGTARFPEGYIWDGSEWHATTNNSDLEEVDYDLGVTLAELLQAE